MTLRSACVSRNRLVLGMIPWLAGRWECGNRLNRFPGSASGVCPGSVSRECLPPTSVLTRRDPPDPSEFRISTGYQSKTLVVRGKWAERVSRSTTAVNGLGIHKLFRISPIGSLITGQASYWGRESEWSAYRVSQAMLRCQRNQTGLRDAPVMSQKANAFNNRRRPDNSPDYQCRSSITISPAPTDVLTNESRQNIFSPLSSAIEQSTIETSRDSSATSP